MSEPLTVSEAAKALKLSTRKVYELAASGELACYRFGSAVRFAPEHLEEYKSKCLRTAKPKPAAPTPEPIPEGMQLVNFLGRIVLMPIPPPPPPPPSASERRRQRKAEDARRKEERRALVSFHASKRRAAKIQRTPPWADLDAMRAVYDEAARLSRESGILHNVDHIVPLQGKTVSGLHVANNLQILTASENSRKRNRYEHE